MNGGENSREIQVGILAGLTISMLAAWSRPQPTGGLLPKPEPVVMEIGEGFALDEAGAEPYRDEEETELPVIALNDAMEIVVRQEERRKAARERSEASTTYTDYLLHATPDTGEQIATEIFYGELEEVAQLISAEAENQPYEGKVKVGCVVFNRVDHPDFPNTVHEVIFQPRQFSVIDNGAYDQAGWTVTEEDYNAALEAYTLREDGKILYFTARNYGRYGTPAYQYGDHYFCTE